MCEIQLIYNVESKSESINKELNVSMLTFRLKYREIVKVLKHYGVLALSEGEYINGELQREIR